MVPPHLVRKSDKNLLVDLFVSVTIPKSIFASRNIQGLRFFFRIKYRFQGFSCLASFSVSFADHRPEKTMIVATVIMAIYFFAKME